jgi:aspartokinase-like uncharacterized kinase
MPFYVLKLGGSLIGSAKSLISRLLDLNLKGYSFLIVPGGGPMADLIRDIYYKRFISDEAAHWMAILAMEQYAYLLADDTGAVLTTDITPCIGVRVLLPYQALLNNDFGLEHCWDYTSDAIAVLVASRLNADLIKATDVDGIIINGRLAREIPASSLEGMETCIDQGSLKLLTGRNCWVLNGTQPDIFVESMLTGKGGTIIKG